MSQTGALVTEADEGMNRAAFTPLLPLYNVPSTMKTSAVRVRGRGEGGEWGGGGGAVNGRRAGGGGGGGA